MERILRLPRPSGRRPGLLRRISPLVSSYVLVTLIVIALMIEAYGAYASLRTDTERELATFADIVGRNLQRSLQEADVILRHVAVTFEEEQLLGYGGRSLRTDDLQALRANSPEMAEVFLAGADSKRKGRGREVAHDTLHDASFEYDFYQVHKDDPDIGLYISDPFLDWSSGEMSFVVSRRLNHPDGRFAGIVGVRFSIVQMEDLIAHLTSRLPLATLVFKGNGRVLVRTPHSENLPELDLGRDPALSYGLEHLDGDDAARSRPASGRVVEMISPVDRAARLASFERVGELPVIVSVSIREDELLQRWFGRLEWLGTTGLLAIAVVLLLLRTIHRQVQRIQREKRRLEAITDAVRDPWLILDEDHTIVRANPAARRELLLPESSQQWRRALGSAQPILDHLPVLDGPPERQHCRRYDGSMFPAESSAARVEWEGRPMVMLQLHNVEERERYQASLMRQAYCDEVTGLPNRTLLAERMTRGLAAAHRYGYFCGLLFIDIDHFKRVNDSIGHAGGDALLHKVGERLAEIARHSDTTARFGGDEFIIFLDRISGRSEAVKCAQRVMEAFEQPVQVEDRQLMVSATVGVALYPFDGDSAEQLLKNADAAMYEAKARGRNRIGFYGRETGERIERHLELDMALRGVLARNELRVVYQPIVDAVTGEVVKAEALLRWDHPVMGAVRPDEFIAIAEENGSILELGVWVLEEACKLSRDFRARHGRSLKVAVNVSASQFKDSDLPRIVDRAIRRAGITAEDLELELTESVLVSHAEAVNARINNVKQLGISLALDDFGTGYSSLSYLTRFPFDTLKIDRAFVARLPENHQSLELTNAIVAMAKSLNLKVVAEGVETDSQARVLRKMGCEHLQGYLFGRPMDRDDFLDGGGKIPSRPVEAPALAESG